MKDYCFTEFCCFLSNLNMNQPRVYIYPLPFGTPSSSHPSRLIQSPGLSFLSHTANTRWLSIFHVTLCLHLTLSSPLPLSIILFSYFFFKRLISRLLHPWREIKHSVVSVLFNLQWFSLELNISLYFTLFILNFKQHGYAVQHREIHQLSNNKCKQSIIYRTTEALCCKPEQI